MIASVGKDRESVWRAVRRGQSGVRTLRGLPDIPDDLLIAATVDVPLRQPGELKTITLQHIAAAEALEEPSPLDLEWRSGKGERVRLV